jgi:hypothetical protein
LDRRHIHFDFQYIAGVFLPRNRYVLSKPPFQISHNRSPFGSLSQEVIVAESEIRALLSGYVFQEPVLNEASFETRFRDEQAELAAIGVYPTPVSDDARACENLGFVNLYPIPYFYDADGFMYTYDPVAERYTSNPDPATGVYHIYDLVTDRLYTYDPANRTYL